MSSSASCAISGSGKRGGACIPAPTRRAKRPSIRGSTTPPRLRHRTGRCVPRQLKRSAAPECASRTPCSAAPAALRRQPVFDFRAHFCHSAPMETHAFGFRLRANAPEGFPISEGEKRFPISLPLVNRLHRMSFESALGIAAVHEITANASKSGIRVPTRGWSIRRKTSRATCANARRFPDSAHWAAAGVAYAAEQR